MRSAELDGWAVQHCPTKGSDPIVGQYRAVRFLAVIAFAGMSAGSVRSEDAKPEAPAFLDDARKYIIELPNERVPLTLSEKSLMNWTNPNRQQERGAIYVWLQDGRPLVIGSMFTYEYNDKVYKKHEFHSLHSRPLKSTFDGTLAWAPKSPGLNWQDFKESPEPASSHISRLLQMRQLARPFRAELISPNSDHTQLRLVSRPLLEYSSPKNGVIDGTIFSFADATDPEVLLLIEACEQSTDGIQRRGYRYAFARFHYWNIVVFDGDRKVWEAPLDKSHERNPIGDPMNLEKIYNSYQPTP